MPKMDGGGGGSVYGVCRAGKGIEEEKKGRAGWDGMMSSSCRGFNWIIEVRGVC